MHIVRLTAICPLVLALAGGLVPARAANPGDVIISEIAWAGSAANTGDEWVELHNQTASPIALTGWVLTESSGGTLNLVGSIPAGGFYVIEGRSGAAISNRISELNIPSFHNTLSNVGEELMLLDQSSATIDAAGQPATLWFAGVNEAGTIQDFTMERNQVACGFAADGTVPASWHTNDGITRNGLDSGGTPLNGTPGAPNSGWVAGSILMIVSGTTPAPRLVAAGGATPIVVTATVTSLESCAPRVPDTVSLYARPAGGSWTASPMVPAGGDAYTYSWSPPGGPGVYEFYVAATAGSVTVPGYPPPSPDFVGFYDPGALPCVGAVRSVDANGAITNSGAPVMTAGLVTTGNPAFSTQANDFFIVDDCAPAAGIAVNGASGVSFAVTPGDQIVALGSLSQFSGRTELEPRAVVVLASGLPVAPVTMTLASLLPAAEAFEGRLVRVNNLTILSGTWPFAGSDASLTVSDDGGASSFTLFVDRDTDVDGTTAPPAGFALVAIVDQFDTTSPFLQSYRLVPRSAADVIAPATGVDALGPPVAIYPAFVSVPNPARSRLEVSFQVPGGKALPVRLSVYDMRGRRVATMVEESLLEPGLHRALWPGQDQSGRSVAAGVYLLELWTPAHTAVARTVLLR
jgi:hypothetical protein